MPLAIPTLTVVDHADGSGATATVEGSTAGSTNEVFAQAVDGQLGTATWTSYGSRTGDGTVTLEVSKGHYLFKVVSSLSGERDLSNVAYLGVTDGADPLHERLLSAVKSRIQLLTLTGLTSISLRTVLADSSTLIPSLPAVLIGLVGQEVFTPGGGSNSHDEIVYPVGVFILAADQHNVTSARATYLKWREQIARAFHHQALSAVAESKVCFVEGAEIVPLAAWMNGLLASSLVVKCVVRQTRGLT